MLSMLNQRQYWHKNLIGPILILRAVLSENSSIQPYRKKCLPWHSNAVSFSLLLTGGKNASG